MEPHAIFNNHCPVSQYTSNVRAPCLPCFQHFTAEELASTQGIDAETFPDMSFIECTRESHKSNMSLQLSPRSPDMVLRSSPPPASISSEEVSEVKNRRWPTASPKKITQHCFENVSRSYSTDREDSLKYKCQTTSPDTEQKTPDARTKAADVYELRKQPLTYRTPDYSKVEPKVRFPKGSQNLPKSRHCSKMEFTSPESSLVLKAPADIMTEVLLSIPDESFATSDSDRPLAGAPNFTLPQQFKCHHQATTLFEQLQEDYSNLLIKYAEAENTIDRLRLEAKVNLYSDPPKPGHMVQSGLNHKASGFIKMDFPKAQRAEINSTSVHPNTHSTDQESSSACSSTTSPEPQVEEHPARILCSQADKLIQQMQTFKNLLECQKLKHFERMKGLSEFAEELDSLERGYLSVKKGNKLLQQGGGEISPFDTERELENVIFQCGLHLKELVDQMGQEQPTSEALPSPLPQTTTSPVSSEAGETITHPQDGIISPEMDSGFVGSESSRQTPAATPSPLHQRFSESLSVAQEGKLWKNLTVLDSASSNASSSSLSETSVGNWLSADPPRKTSQRKGRDTPSCSLQCRVIQTEQKKTNSGTHDFELSHSIVPVSEALSVSEAELSDQSTESTLTTTTSQSPFPSTPRQSHDISFPALSTTQATNDKIYSILDDVSKLTKTLEHYLENSMPLHNVKAAPSAQEKYSNYKTFKARIRSSDQLRDISRGRSEAEEYIVKQNRGRPSCIHKQKTQPDIMSTTPQPLLSRCTQTSTAAPESSPESCSAHTLSVHRKTQHRQHPAVCVQVSKPAAESDNGSRAVPLCPQCFSRQRGQLKDPDGEHKAITRSTCCHNCPACECLKPCRSSEEASAARPKHSHCFLNTNDTDSQRLGDSPICKCSQPVKIPDLELRSKCSATPTTLMQLMEVCPTPPQLYSVPLYVFSGNNTGTGYRSHKGTTMGPRRSLSTDKQQSVDSSLNRAIHAARRMKLTSGHMALSLAAELDHKLLLGQA